MNRRGFFGMMGGAAAATAVGLSAIASGTGGTRPYTDGGSILPDNDGDYSLMQKMARASVRKNGLPEFMKVEARYCSVVDDDLMAMKSLAMHTKKRITADRFVARYERNLIRQWDIEDMRSAAEKFWNYL